jgi:hypothetical protein
MISPLRATIWIVFIWISVSGCERPFIEQRAPDIEIVSPDLDIIQTNRTISLMVKASSLNRVDSVLMNGLHMKQESNEETFSLDVNLSRGVNELRIEAYGSDDTRRSDTLTAVFLPGDNDIAEIRLPGARGGHTATRLIDGDLLVVGGAELPTAAPVSSGLLYDWTNLSASPRSISSVEARMEHTASRLPDGRVLVIGGSVISQPTVVSQLVESVEVYDLELKHFTSVPISGEPIRRSGHTTVVFPVRIRGVIEVYIYLFGGFGDVAYRPEPRMGVRSDLRIFEFRNDSLVAAGPTFGPFIEAMADHTVMSIQPTVGADAEFLFSGSYFASEDNFDTFAFESIFSTSSSIHIDDLDPMIQPRSGHAAGRMVDGEIIIFGGHTFGAPTAMGSIEVYHSRVQRFFPFTPEVTMLQERWGHTATNWDDNRILLLGGFGFAGAGLRTSEWFLVK